MPPRPSSYRPLVVALLAGLLPGVIVGGWLEWLGRPLPTETPELTRRLEAMLARGKPDVVLLGASKLFTDVDKDRLADGLGVPRKDLVNLAQSGSNAPLWYAILENRVYAAGHRPRLVLVYSTVDWMLGTDLTPAVAARVAGQLQGEEPVLAEKVYHGRSPTGWLARVGDARARVRDGVFGWVRDVSVGLTLAEPGPDGVRAAGGELAAPALDKLFGLSATLEASGGARVIPIAEASREGTDVSARSIDDTLAPDLIDLAAQHGSRIVFLRAPVRRSQEAQVDVDPELERAFVELLNARGAGYVDLRSLRLPDSDFGDAVHANATGRRSVTAAIIDSLRDLEALGDTPFEAAPLPATWERPAAHRTGTPPALPALQPKRSANPCGWEAKVAGLDGLSDLALQRVGVGQIAPFALLEDGVPLRAHAGREDFADRCAGAWQLQDRVAKFSPTGANPEAAADRAYTLAWADDAPLEAPNAAPAWWVYPGTTLHLTWQQPPPAGPFGYDLAAFGFGEGAGAPTLRLAGGAEVPIPRSGSSLHAQGQAPAPTGPWSVEITSPADGPTLLLQRLVMGNAGDARWYVGDGSGAERAETTASMQQATATYAAEPSPVPAPTLVRTEPTGVRAYDIAAAGLPEPKAFYKVASVAACTPLRVSAGGSDLGLPTARIEDVATTPGAFAQVGTELWVHPPAADSALAFSLDPTRKCRGMRWLYPGDTLRLAFDPASLASLADPVAALTVGVAALEPGDTRLRVQVRSDAVTLLDTEVSLAEAIASPPRLPVDAATGPFEVILSTGADAPYVLVTSLTLTGVRTGLLP